MKPFYPVDWSHAPIVRILFAVAGGVGLLSTLLGIYISPWFFAVVILVTIMQLLFALTGWCPMAICLQLAGIECNLRK